MWYSDPERNQQEFKRTPYFSSESLAVAFLTYNNTDHKGLLSLEEKKGTGDVFWSQKESNIIKFSCQQTSFNYLQPLLNNILSTSLGVSYHFSVAVRRNSSTAYRHKLSLLITMNIFI